MILSTHPATCPMLPFPANGNITYDPATNVATHSCDPGYALSNTGQRICQRDNQWSGTTVICERMKREDLLIVNKPLFFIPVQVSCVQNSQTLRMDK